ncbi:MULTISPECIES: bifunctional 5,10-methylenetetrahydrofolate dehydrogenase/5,10-methenyltetrahydrofolate cyclohydrolase [unclassified Romboutsia]|uniref:bifunctional 5,10-methylenetetrahydrofolate dehydrogenase/5,10-methenyltetrahydrofolate cyclohydrolase n=1 Tax=unclassified Romboutsia TaxID=2626894 RepID=UPI0008210718|nr:MULTISPECIES: tetrahydrofolate dehydrogenase/cyclohydrolase catalytic domain-containing protein [unclassified Romboutsia]SCI00183.1 Bifunctional protein FolD [uncultured Clostridium sp.]
MEVSVAKGQIIKGKPVADEMSENLIKEVNELSKEGIIPKLAILRVGEKANDLAYERGALKKCETIGIETEVIVLEEGVTQDQYIEALEDLNKNPKINGILTFRPLPKGIDEEVIKHVIDPKKDVDCFNPLNTAKVMEGDKTGFPPCTPTAVVEILKHYNVDLNGANVAVLGRSMVVGKPVAMLLLGENATVNICHSRTKNLSEVTSKADILVAAVGRARMVTPEYIKEGAVVIDVGINAKPEGGGICGDVDTDSVIEKASMITPVPAGVGSVTTSVLAKHVIKACKLQNNK